MPVGAQKTRKFCFEITILINKGVSSNDSDFIFYKDMGSDFQAIKEHLFMFIEQHKNSSNKITIDLVKVASNIIILVDRDNLNYCNVANDLK